jgi:hypothetical protein
MATQSLPFWFADDDIIECIHGTAERLTTSDARWRSGGSTRHSMSPFGRKQTFGEMRVLLVLAPKNISVHHGCPSIILYPSSLKLVRCKPLYLHL